MLGGAANDGETATFDWLPVLLASDDLLGELGAFWDVEGFVVVEGRVVEGFSDEEGLGFEDDVPLLSPPAAAELLLPVVVLSPSSVVPELFVDSSELSLVLDSWLELLVSSALDEEVRFVAVPSSLVIVVASLERVEVKSAALAAPPKLPRLISNVVPASSFKLVFTRRFFLFIYLYSSMVSAVARIIIILSPFKS